MSLRRDCIEAGARDMFEVGDLAELHPEDQESGLRCAEQMLDSFLSVLADRSKELAQAAGRRHPIGKGPLSTPRTVVSHAVAVLQETHE